mmetsp:Transcript_81202/g.143181  ORF Transcript_81202/g.143181 Transcript_81202/m.143181 type:complete len:174 (+) Transcript_81202:70-591(+)
MAKWLIWLLPACSAITPAVDVLLDVDGPVLANVLMQVGHSMSRSSGSNDTVSNQTASDTTSKQTAASDSEAVAKSPKGDKTGASEEALDAATLGWSTENDAMMNANYASTYDHYGNGGSLLLWTMGATYAALTVLAVVLFMICADRQKHPAHFQAEKMAIASGAAQGRSQYGM